jgi:NADP-dependent 3-hydroxy acid dehydrogenase YdfG
MPKTILITGASTGIGRETAVYFAKKGWNVAATMRNTEKGTDLLNYQGIRLFSLDVTDTQSVKTAIDAVIAAYGGIDVLLNNAGYALVGAFEAMTEQQIHRQMNTNVIGVMNVTRAVLPHFRSKKEGLVINITSMGGLITFPLYSVYHATKWAVEGFMESLHFELRQFNIRVKNIEPGAIKTEFENALDFVDTEAYHAYVSQAHANMLETYKTAPGAAIVAQTVYRAATDGSNLLRYPTDAQGKMLLFLRWLLPNSWYFGIVRMILEKGIK